METRNQTTCPLREAKAENGDPAAEYALGQHYMNGDGVGENCAEAVKWFRKAAAKGNGQAQLALGVIYAQGQDVVQD